MRNPFGHTHWLFSCQRDREIVSNQVVEIDFWRSYRFPLGICQHDSLVKCLENLLAGLYFHLSKLNPVCNCLTNSYHTNSISQHLDTQSSYWRKTFYLQKYCGNSFIYKTGLSFLCEAPTCGIFRCFERKLDANVIGSLFEGIHIYKKT